MIFLVVHEKVMSSSIFRSMIYIYSIDNFADESDSKFKLNADKTEFLIIGTPKQCGKLDGFFPDMYPESNYHTSSLSEEFGSHF